MQIHYWDATWTLSKKIIFVTQPHTDMSTSRLAAGDSRMEEKVIIAVGKRPVQFDQSLYTYRDNPLLVTTGSILQ